MVNRLYIKDDDLQELFKKRIIQKDNYNANSELFIYNDMVFKIYYGDSDFNNFNIQVIDNIFNKYSSFKCINELVLPENCIIYNNKIVGFSMPYINGITLEELINNGLDSTYDMKEIFINLLGIIKKFKDLPFDFFIGDLHEKNVIIDKDNNIKIIDPDSFIIDKKKLYINEKYLIGKYVNHFFNNSELESIKCSADYYSLLCMILNYTFKDIIADKSEPISELKREKQFKEIHPILNKIDTEFVLSENDIDKIFDFKTNLKYEKKDNKSLKKEIKRIRKIL